MTLYVSCAAPWVVLLNVHIMKKKTHIKSRIFKLQSGVSCKWQYKLSRCRLLHSCKQLIGALLFFFCCWELNIKWSHTRQIIESCGYNYPGERLELMRNTRAPGITSKSSEFINFQRRSRYSGWQTGLSLSHLLVRKLCDFCWSGFEMVYALFQYSLSRPLYHVSSVMLITMYSQICDNASRQS